MDAKPRVSLTAPNRDHFAWVSLMVLEFFLDAIAKAKKLICKSIAQNLKQVSLTKSFLASQDSWRHHRTYDDITELMMASLDWWWGPVSILPIKPIKLEFLSEFVGDIWQSGNLTGSLTNRFDKYLNHLKYFCSFMCHKYVISNSKLVLTLTDF